MFKIYFILTILATGADGAPMRQMHIYDAGDVATCNERAPGIEARIEKMEALGVLFAAPYRDASVSSQCMRMVLSVNGDMQ